MHDNNSSKIFLNSSYLHKFHRGIISYYISIFQERIVSPVKSELYVIQERIMDGSDWLICSAECLTNSKWSHDKTCQSELSIIRSWGPIIRSWGITLAGMFFLTYIIAYRTSNISLFLPHIYSVRVFTESFMRKLCDTKWKTKEQRYLVWKVYYENPLCFCGERKLEMLHLLHCFCVKITLQSFIIIFMYSLNFLQPRTLILINQYTLCKKHLSLTLPCLAPVSSPDINGLFSVWGCFREVSWLPADGFRVGFLLIVTVQATPLFLLLLALCCS